MPKLTYEEIISQISRRLGYTAMEKSLRSDFRYAISYAENELMGETDPTSATTTLDVIDTQAEYSLENDFGLENFNNPFHLSAYTTDGVRLVVEELEYPQWLSWNPLSTKNQTANDVLPSDRNFVDAKYLIEWCRLHNRIAVSIHPVKDDGDDEVSNVLSLKPAITGQILLNYSIHPSRDIFENLAAYPSLKDEFHGYIISGAVWRLAQIEAGQTRDPARIQFFQTVEARAYAEFQKAITKITVGKVTRVSFAQARADLWYDRPNPRVRRY